MAQGDLPPQLKEQINQFQTLQQQLQTLAQQKSQYDMQAREMERANATLAETMDDATIYKSVGAYLVKTPGKSAVLKEIEEESEMIGVRLKNVERQEARMRESANELQSKIENHLARLRGGPAGAPAAKPARDASDDED